MVLPVYLSRVYNINISTSMRPHTPAYTTIKGLVVLGIDIEIYDETSGMVYKMVGVVINDVYEIVGVVINHISGTVNKSEKHTFQ